jgi:hypothetical protein
VGRSVDLDAAIEEIFDAHFPEFQITYFAKIEILPCWTLFVPILAGILLNATS